MTQTQEIITAPASRDDVATKESSADSATGNNPELTAMRVPRERADS